MSEPQIIITEEELGDLLLIVKCWELQTSKERNFGIQRTIDIIERYRKLGSDNDVDKLKKRLIKNFIFNGNYPGRKKE